MRLTKPIILFTISNRGHEYAVIRDVDRYVVVKDGVVVLDTPRYDDARDFVIA